MKRALRIGLSSAVLLGIAAAFALSSRDAARASDPAPASAAPRARLVVGHGEVDGFSTEIAIATIDPSKNVAAVTPLATLTHVRGSAIRGAARDEVAFVVASEEAPRGTSYDGALFRVEKGRVTRLCGGVARAATPLITSSGRVWIARGVDGQDPPAADAQKLVLRTDDLTIDDVDPITGATRTLWRGTGYQAFLGAMTARDEAVVYHSDRSGAALVILEPTGLTRSVPVMPFARDFSFDRVHGAIVFANLGEVSALDLGSLTLKTLYRTSNEHPMPFALPSGDVAVSSVGDKGLAILQAGQHRLLSPLGDGSDAATHSDGRWVALRHTPRAQTTDEPPRVVAWDPLLNKTVALDVPATHFVESFGFVGGAP